MEENIMGIVGLIIVFVVILLVIGAVGNLLGLIVPLLIFAAIGWLTGKVLRGRGYGPIGNTLLGLGGGIIGSWIFGLLRIPAFTANSGLLGTIIGGVVGALVLIWAVRLIGDQGFAR